MAVKWEEDDVLKQTKIQIIQNVMFWICFLILLSGLHVGHFKGMLLRYYIKVKRDAGL